VREIWQDRAILFQLGMKNIVVRYKQTILGLMWSFLNPLLSILVFTLVFSVFIGLRVQGKHTSYTLLVLSGLICWQLFSETVNNIESSLINNSNILNKIYFPRIIFCISSGFVTILESIIALLLFFVLTLFFHYHYSYRLLYLPFLILYAYLLAFGPGLIVASLTIKYRDLKHIIPVILKIFFYLSPVVYSIEIVPDKFLNYYILNPIVGLISVFRWILLDHTLNIKALELSLAFCFVVNIIAFYVFIKTEKSLADEI
jgi:lipopolysaccharide transport system permease protein